MNPNLNVPLNPILSLITDVLGLPFPKFYHFSAWAKKADTSETEGALLAALDEKEEIPILPYSSLFIFSSENNQDYKLNFH